jgi:hypothetical protein
MSAHFDVKVPDNFFTDDIIDPSFIDDALNKVKIAEDFLNANPSDEVAFSNLEEAKKN